MKRSNLESYVSEVLASTGITLNGSNPWDIQVHHQDLWARLLKQGSLGLGEAYIEQWWDCERLDQFFERILRANLESWIKSNPWLLLKLILQGLINRQTKTRALQVGRVHYDLGNALFEAMLDKSMTYTCGYWKQANNLDEAQEHKLDLSCQKLGLKPGMRVLDIGCGFGAFAKYAAEHYGVSVVGITISRQQQLYAQKNCAGLPVEIRFQDYRDLNESFDCIVSLGMFEHVGLKNYKTYMQKVHQCLKDDGLFLLHTIGNNTPVMASDPWIRKYIFPNGYIPCMSQLSSASEKQFIMEDWHNFGADYDKTLMAWNSNFNQHWNELKPQYDERFYRMWSYYLLSCAAAFRTRDLQLWQLVFSKKGIEGGYQAPR